MTMLIQFLGILLVLIMPGGFFLLIGTAIWRKMRLPQAEVESYLKDESGQAILDWDWYMNSKYPRRYRMTVSMPRAIKKWVGGHVSVPLRRFKSKYWTREHMMDLRGSDYQYGYLSPVEQILYASFKAFMLWLGDEGSWVLETDKDTDKVAPDIWRAQSDAAQTARLLYFWWAGKRIADIRHIGGILDPGLRKLAIDRQVADDERMLGLLLSIRSVMLVDGGFPT
jgi:hypothetical protein